MLHYSQQTFDASAVGSVIKEVVCERCGLKYYYQMTRWAYGSGIAPYGEGAIAAEANAERKARIRLMDSLEHECEAVPCPQCGHVQKQVVDYLRRHMYPNLRVLAWILPIVGLIFSLFLLRIWRENLPVLREPWITYAAIAFWAGIWFALRALRTWLISRGNWLQIAIQLAPPALLPQDQ